LLVVVIRAHVLPGRAIHAFRAIRKLDCGFEAVAPVLAESEAHAAVLVAETVRPAIGPVEEKPARAPRAPSCQHVCTCAHVGLRAIDGLHDHRRDLSALIIYEAMSCGAKHE